MVEVTFKAQPERTILRIKKLSDGPDDWKPVELRGGKGKANVEEDVPYIFEYISLGTAGQDIKISVAQNGNSIGGAKGAIGVNGRGRGYGNFKA